MAVNKHALIRYRVLDRCLGNPGKRYFIEDLLSECNAKLQEIEPHSRGIQRRQLFDDINYMESEEGWSAEITRISWGKKKYYRYKDLNFSISKQPLNEAEVDQLKSAMEIISRFSGMPQFQWISEFASKIDPTQVSGVGTKAIISFDNNSYLTGIERLSELYYAILYKKTLSISYHPFKSVKPQLLNIHPYYLKQYNNRWFLLGYNHELQRLSTVALDRIREIKEKPIKYLENTEYDFEEYFEDIIGVTRHDLPVEKVIMHFNRDAAPYIISKPLHGSQKIVRNSSNGLTLSVEIIPNFEFEAIILSFGENVVIIAPTHLRDKINSRIQLSLENIKSAIFN